MFPQDQLRLIVCLLASIPLSFTLSFIKNPKLILAFTCCCSIVMQMIVFREWIVLLWAQQNITYFLCKFLPRAKIGKMVMIQTFAVLVIIQMIRMYMSYGVESVDITAIFMMQVFQYISFSYNYQDGLEGKKNQFTIVQLPPYVQYLGYVSFIPSCLVGPVFQFKDFQSYLYKTGVYSDMKNGFTTVPAMKKQLKTTLFCVGFYFLLMPFPLSFMLKPEFNNMNFIMKSLYLLVSIMGARFKYYAAWSLGMVAMNGTGLTYNPKVSDQGKFSNDWDRIVVSNIWDFEMDPSMKKKADGWNIPIQTALKRYIYDRIYIPSQTHTPKQKKKLQIKAQQTTLAVSALWHGLYTGYFLAFFHWGLLLQVSQQLFRIEKQSPTLKKWRKKLHYAQLILINYFLGFFGVCFQYMTWQKNLLFFSIFNYVPLIVTYVLNIVIVRLGLFSKKTTKSKKSQKVEENAKIQEKAQ